MITGLLGTGPAIRHAKATGGDPLNVVVIEVDDLDVGTLNTAIANGLMPNLAQLANAGTTFTNSFVSDSVCCPSRATFLTGLYAHNTGVHLEQCHEFQDPANGNHESHTVATWLQALQPQYYTGLVGKYLNGYGTNDGWPTSDCRNPNYYGPGWDEWHAIAGEFALMSGYTLNDTVEGSTTLWKDPCTPYLCDYQTTVLQGRATDFLTHAYGSARPFFLWVTPTAPHLETTAAALLSCSFNDPFGQAHTIRVPPAYDHLADGISLPTGGSYNEFDVSDKPRYFNGP